MLFLPKRGQSRREHHHVHHEDSANVGGRPRAMDVSPPIVDTADVSICSQICRLAIHEHGLACEHVNVDIECRMQNYEPWFIRIQPKMTVPAMTYGETVIGDSKDILYFLAERHPGLYPAGPERASIDASSINSTVASG
jgi:hypothetical protein